MVLTVRQIANLANMAGFNVDVEELDEDERDIEVLIAVGDDGEKIAFYNDEPNEGGMSLD